MLHTELLLAILQNLVLGVFCLLYFSLKAVVLNPGCTLRRSGELKTNKTLILKLYLEQIKSESPCGF